MGVVHRPGSRRPVGVGASGVKADDHGRYRWQLALALRRLESRSQRMADMCQAKLDSSPEEWRDLQTQWMHVENLHDLWKATR